MMVAIMVLAMCVTMFVPDIAIAAPATPPTVVPPTTPYDGEPNVALDATVSVTFDEVITVVTDLSGVSIGGATGVLASFDDTDTITIAHDAFVNDTSYTVTIPAGTVQDGESTGNEEVSWSFTTVAAPTTPPGVDSTTPIDTAVDVDILDPLVIVFDEDVSLINPSGIHISAGATGVTATLGTDNRTLTATHDAFLELTQYWVIIQSGVVQDAEGSPNNQYIWSFTTEAVGAPTVVNTTPDNGATDVALDVAVSAIFDEPISEGPNFDDIIIWNADTSWAPGVSALIEKDTVTVTIAHDNFDELTTYYPVIPAGAVQDIDGNLNAYYEWSFTTMEVGAPGIASTSPANGATGIALDVIVSAVFDEDVTVVTDLAGIVIYYSPTETASGVSAILEADRTITIAHDTFNDSATCYVIIPAGVVQDAEGNLNAKHEWIFTTTAAGIPTVISTTPANLETGVALNATVSATFDEEIIAVDLSNVAIYYHTSGGGDATVSGVSASIDGDTVTMSFTHNDFAESTTYYPVIPAGAVQSTSGFSNARYEWGFTTIEMGPPVVTSALPINGAIDVALDADVEVYFNEDVTIVSGASAYGILINDSTIGVSASFNPGHDRIQIFHDEFAPETTYTVTIPAGVVQDSSGNPNALYAWSFTTVDTTAPSVNSTIPANGAVVSISTLVSATFNEDITIIDPSGVTIDNAATGVAASLDVDNRTVIIAHDDFAFGNTFTVTIAAGAIEDISGNPNDLYTFSFTTGNMPVLNFSGRPYSVPEAGPAATITVVLSEQSLDAVTVDY